MSFYIAPELIAGKELEEILAMREFCFAIFLFLILWQFRKFLSKDSRISICNISDSDSQVALLIYFTFFFICLTYYHEYEILGHLNMQAIITFPIFLLLPMLKIKKPEVKPKT